MVNKVLSVLTLGTWLVLLLGPLVTRLSASQKPPKVTRCASYSVIEKTDSTIFQVDCRGRVKLLARGDTLLVILK